MIPVIMLLVFLSAIAPFAYATHEAGVDASKIAADAAQNQDSLKEDFHRANLIRRAFMALGFAALFTGLLVLCGFRWWFLFPYLAFFGASFGYTFNKQLNIARRLPAFYVSTSPRAAVSDKLIGRFARKIAFSSYRPPISPYTLSAILYTGFLIAGFLVFLAGIVCNVWRIGWF